MPGRISPRLLSLLERYITRVSPAYILMEQDGLAYIYDRNGNKILEDEQDHSHAFSVAYELGGTIIVSGNFDLKTTPTIPDNLDIELIGFDANIKINEYLINTTTNTPRRIVIDGIKFTFASTGNQVGLIYEAAPLVGDGYTIKIKNSIMTYEPNAVLSEMIYAETSRETIIIDNEIILDNVDPFTYWPIYLIAGGNRAPSSSLTLIGNKFIWNTTYTIDCPLIKLFEFPGSESIIESNIIKSAIMTCSDGLPGSNFYAELGTRQGIFRGNYINGIGGGGFNIRPTAHIFTDNIIINICNSPLEFAPSGYMVARGNIFGCTDQMTQCQADITVTSGESVIIDDNIFIPQDKWVGTQIPYISGLTPLPRFIVENNLSIFRNENSGEATLSGDGVTTDFLIGNHGVQLYRYDRDRTDTIEVICQPISADAIASSPLKCYLSDEDADRYYESIRVTFNTAPPAGTNNVIIRWYARRKIAW